MSHYDDTNSWFVGALLGLTGIIAPLFACHLFRRLSTTALRNSLAFALARAVVHFRKRENSRPVTAAKMNGKCIQRIPNP